MATLPEFPSAVISSCTQLIDALVKAVVNSDGNSAGHTPGNQQASWNSTSVQGEGQSLPKHLRVHFRSIAYTQLLDLSNDGYKQQADDTRQQANSVQLAQAYLQLQAKQAGSGDTLNQLIEQFSRSKTIRLQTSALQRQLEWEQPIIPITEHERILSLLLELAGSFTAQQQPSATATTIMGMSTKPSTLQNLSSGLQPPSFSTAVPAVDDRLQPQKQQQQQQQQGGSVTAPVSSPDYGANWFPRPTVEHNGTTTLTSEPQGPDPCSLPVSATETFQTSTTEDLGFLPSGGASGTRLAAMSQTPDLSTLLYAPIMSDVPEALPVQAADALCQVSVYNLAKQSSAGFTGDKSQPEQQQHLHTRHGNSFMSCLAPGVLDMDADPCQWSIWDPANDHNTELHEKLSVTKTANVNTDDVRTSARDQNSKLHILLAPHNDASLVAMQDFKPAAQKRVLLGKVVQPVNSATGQTVAGLPLSLTPDQEAVRLSLLALGGTLSAMKMLARGSVRGHSNRLASQQQLVERILHGAELRLRLQAFLMHFQHASNQAMQAKQSQADSIQSNVVVAGQAETVDPITTSFICCVRKLVMEYEAQLQLMEAAFLGNNNNMQHSHKRQHTTTTQSVRNSQLTLLQLVVEIDPLLAQLHLLANVCSCLPASQHQNQTYHTKHISSRQDINVQLSKWQTSPSFNLLHVLHAHHHDGGLELPFSGWMSEGLPHGTSLLDTLYSGLQQADSTLATVFRQLFAAASAPYLSTLWQWLYRNNFKNLQPYAAPQQPQVVKPSFQHDFSALPGSSSSLIHGQHPMQAIQEYQQTQEPSRPPFPVFLAKVQHEAILAGTQQQLLLQLEPQIGDIARRFARIWTRELGFGDTNSAQGQTYKPDAGLQTPEEASVWAGSLATNRQDVRKVSEALTRASDTCWQELESVTSLLAKRREAAAAAKDLAAFARQQAEEARQEGLRDAKEAQAIEARRKRAAVLAAQLAAADQAFAARQAAKAEEIRSEQQQLLADAVQEHSAALSVLQAELDKFNRTGRGDQNLAIVAKANLAVSRATSEGGHASNPTGSIQTIQHELIRTEWRMKRLGLSAERQANWQSLEAETSLEWLSRVQPAQTMPNTVQPATTATISNKQADQSTGMPVATIPAAVYATHGQQPDASAFLQQFSLRSTTDNEIPNDTVSLLKNDDQAKKVPDQTSQVIEAPISNLVTATLQTLTGQGATTVNKAAIPPYNRMQRRSDGISSRSIADMPAAGLPSRRVSAAGMPKPVPNKGAPPSSTPSHTRSRSFSHTPGTPDGTLSRRDSFSGKPAAGRRSVSRSVSNVALMALKQSRQTANVASNNASAQPKQRKQWDTAAEDSAGGDQQQVKPFDWYEHLYGRDWVNKEASVPAGSSLPWHDAVQDEEDTPTVTSATTLISSLVGSAEPAPVSEEVEVCVALPVMSHYWLTTSALWRVLTQELKLMDMCAALRRIFFFEAGDFALHLKDCLLDRWKPLYYSSSGGGAQQPATQWGITSGQMQAALGEAIAMCPSIASDPLVSRLTLVRGREGRDVYCSPSHSSRPGALQTAVSYGIGPGGLGDTMLLQVDVPWPMNSILCGNMGSTTGKNALPGIKQNDVDVMAVYSDVASALMRLRVCAAALQKAWLVVGKPTALHPYTGLPQALLDGSGSNNVDDLPYSARQTVARRLAAVRGWIHEALHFLGAFQRHCSASLMGACWRKFEKRMLQEGPMDIVQMAQAHTEYVLSAASACFLPLSTETLHKDSLQLAVSQAIYHTEAFTAIAACFTDIPQQAKQPGLVATERSADTSSADVYPQLKAAHHTFRLAVNLVWKRLQEPVTDNVREQTMAIARSLQAELECNWYSKREPQNSQ